MDVRRQVPRTDVVLAALPDTATSLRPVHPVLPDEPDATTVLAQGADLVTVGSPPVLGRIERGRCLLDLRALPAEQDAALRDAVLACMS